MGMDVISSGKTTFARDEQPENALLPTTETPLARTADTRAVQPLKAEYTTELPLPIVAVAKEVQPENAFEPTETLFPIITLDRAVQPEQAYEPRDVSDAGKSTDAIARQFWKA